MLQQTMKLEQRFHRQDKSTFVDTLLFC